MKFTDDTALVGLIFDGGKTAYREEVQGHVVSFRFLGVHVADDLSWHVNTAAVVSKAQ